MGSRSKHGNWPLLPWENIYPDLMNRVPYFVGPLIIGICFPRFLCFESHVTRDQAKRCASTRVLIQSWCKRPGEENDVFWVTDGPCQHCSSEPAKALSIEGGFRDHVQWKQQGKQKLWAQRHGDQWQYQKTESRGGNTYNPGCSCSCPVVQPFWKFCPVSALLVIDSPETSFCCLHSRV